MDEKQLKELELYFNEKYVRIEDCDEKMAKNEGIINKLENAIDGLKGDINKILIGNAETKLKVDHLWWLTMTAVAGIIGMLIKSFF